MIHSHETLHPPGGPSRLRWHGRTDRGKVRRNNEDAFLALRFDAREIQRLGKYGEDSTENADFVFAVSDGMGGANAGEFASRIAVDKITRLLPRAFRQLATTGIEAGFADVLAELYEQTHRALLFLGAGDEDCAGMGATLSLSWFTQGWMYFGHIGDSRIYYLPKGGSGEAGGRGGGTIRQISHDDTYVGWLFRNGKLNEREARNHPGRHSLQKALGAGHQFVDPQVGAVACEPGDRFLLCTDGLIDGLYDEQLLEWMGGEGDPADALVEAALERSGRDNITALVVEVAR